MNEFKWYITDEEKYDILEMARKNDLLSEYPKEQNPFREIDILKLFKTQDFQEYLLRDNVFQDDDVESIQQIWWWKLLSERDEAFEYEQYIDPVDGKTRQMKKGIKWVHYLLNEEYFDKTPSSAENVKEKEMEFKEFLEAANLKLMDNEKMKVAVQITSSIVEFGKKLSPPDLSNFLYFVKNFKLYGKDIQVYYGTTSTGTSSMHTTTGTMIINFNKVHGIPKKILDHVTHELNHYIYAEDETIPKTSEKIEEFDAHCSEIGNFIFHHLPIKDLKDVYTWINAGGSLNDPALPRVIQSYRDYLSTLSPKMYRVFFLRLHGLMMKNKFREV